MAVMKTCRNIHTADWVRIRDYSVHMA